VGFGVVPREQSDQLEQRPHGYRTIAYIKYRYTSFFWSRSAVAMFFSTSGNRAETSFPSVIAMMVFCMASLLSYS